MSELYDSLRKCARRDCEEMFTTADAQPNKKYCSPRCRVLADRERRRVTAPVASHEIELDVDQVEDIEGLLAERGLDINDWVIVRVTVNKWEGFYKDEADAAQKVQLRQLKVFMRPKLEQILVRPVEPLPFAPGALMPNPNIVRRGEAKLFFIYGDDQRPDVDETFAQLKLEFVKDQQPEEIIDLGDGMDMPTISQHKTNPAKNWSVQDCANSYGTWLHALHKAAPNTRIRILADNHVTGRLRDYQLSQAKDLYGIRPADIPELEQDLEPLWSIRRLLRLDELGIEYVEPPADTHYAESHVEIVPDTLVAIHGYRTGQNLGKKFIDDYGCSVIYGHQHGHDVFVTDQKRRGVGSRTRLFAIGVGCGANLHGGGGYAPGADWQNSALTVSVFPDGSWSYDPINYENGVLTWRDTQYIA